MSEVGAGGPVKEKARIHCLDVIRGVVLLGILLMNITMFGLGPAAYSNPDVLGGSTGADLWAWIVANVFFEGTQRALFSVLFGAGAVLLLSRLEAAGRTDAADIYYRRTIWLIIFGLVHSFLLLWTGEILFYYGAVALFLYPFRHTAPRKLVALAAALFLMGAVWSYAENRKALDTIEKHGEAQTVLAEGGELDDEQEEAVKEYEELRSDIAPPQDEIDEMLDTYHGSYAKIFVHQAPINAHWEAWGVYRYATSDELPTMLLGMALLQLGVLTLKRSSRLYWAMVLVGYGVGVTVNVFETRAIVDGNFEIPAIASTWATYQVGRLGVAAGHLGLLCLFCRSGWLAWLQRGLAAVGRMALTNYLMHSVICAFVFYGFGFALFGKLQRHELYYVVLGIWVLQLIVSPIWLKHYRFGPAEWLWRSLTYMEPQPLRRTTPGNLQAAAAPALESTRD